MRAKEQTETAAPMRRALLLLLPQEAARLRTDQELMFRAAVPPFLLNRLRWFEDQHFMRLQGRPPEMPIVTYRIDRDDGTVRLPTA
jgi:type IV secretory pathway TraG/TraD family ATPase VirD4